MRSVIILAFLVLAIKATTAAPTDHSEAYAVLIDKRTGRTVKRSASETGSPSVHDLLGSCPTPQPQAQPAPSRRGLIGADTCIWVKDSKQHTGTEKGAITQSIKMLSNKGVPLGFFRNCDKGGTSRKSFDASGSTTFHQKYSVASNPPIDLTQYAYGLSGQVGEFSSAVIERKAQMTISPGKAATLVAYQSQEEVTGTVQVNYPKRVNDHYIWYVYNVKAQLLVGDPVVDSMTIGCNEKVPDLDY